MSEPAKCVAEWIGRDGKNHSCDVFAGHIGKCVCDCGERGYAANPPPAKWMPTQHYKRRKISQEIPA